MKKQRRQRLGGLDALLQTGGALLGHLWRELSAEHAARRTATAEALGPGAPAAEQQIGAYKVQRLLGSGGMGEVWLAFDGRLGRHVAIKRILRGAHMKPQARERFRREAAAAAKLSHPAVVHIYDILEDPLGDAIVMEYVAGETLAQILAAGRQPARQLVAIARQVAQGLAAAHAAGLIHRDLKTQNVVVSAEGQAKILDFGVAKALAREPELDSLTGEGVLVGTFRAMSPEQAEGRPLDARSDLFSFGVLLYEVCTGRSPFLGDSSQQTLRNVVAQAPPPIGALNPELPGPLVALVEELLEKDPARRPPAAAGVAERLEEIERLSALEAMELPCARGTPVPGEQLLEEGPGPFRGPPQGEERARPIPEPFPAVPPAPSPNEEPRPGPGRRWILWASLVLAALGTALLLVQPWSDLAARPIAVLVQEPRIASSPSDERSYLAFALRESALRALTGLRGIDVIGRDEVTEAGVPVQEVARVLAADEVVVSTLACEGQWCQVSLRRQGARDDRIISDTGSFPVSSAPEDSWGLAMAVRIHLRKAYADHPPQSVEERLDAKAADYHRLLSLRRRSDAGEALRLPEIEELERIARSSPGLTEAYLLAAGVARRFLKDLPRAERVLQEAEARHPGDPRLVYERFLVKVEEKDFEAAEAAVAELEKLAPGDVRVSRGRARLLANQGRLEEAAVVRRRMVRERPSWRNLWHLADLEIDLAEESAARQHLDQLLALSPGNARGLEKKAELEWLLGDPNQAVRIYEGLLTREVSPESLGNLGWSLLLAGNYAGAITACRRALALNPGDTVSRLNLGIGHEGVGDRDAARRIYQELVDRNEPTDGPPETTVDDQLIRAQALARLDHCVDAVALTMRALNKEDRNPQVRIKAAVVYALCRDHNTAIVHATEARRRGLSSKWLGIPGFESVRDRPEFRSLLAPATSPPAARRPDVSWQDAEKPPSTTRVRPQTGDAVLILQELQRGLSRGALRDDSSSAPC